MRRFKISIFLPALEGGGSEHVALLLADAFQAGGHSVSLVVAKNVGALTRSIPGGVELVDLGCNRSLTALLPLVRHIDSHKPDVLLSVINHANVLATAAGRIARHRVLTFPRVGFPISSNRSRGIRERLAVYLARWAYRWATQVVCVSKDVSEDTRDILRLRDSAVRTIYNPVLRQELVQRAREPVTHPWFEEPRPSPVLISVGRLSRMKDFATLLRAFAAVKEKLPCRLVILGEGDERTNLDTLAVELGVEDDVWMPGFELNPYRFVSRADLFVMSSRGEGMPNALLEAVALRVPAVSTDCLAGPREVLDDGRLGELVPVGDHAALSAAILRVVRDKEVTLATDEDLQPYTIEACSSSYLKMFEEFSSA